MPKPLESAKDRLLNPIHNHYSVVVNADTTRGELEKALAEQNVSLDTLQKQGFHVRADRKNLISGKQTLTFKRNASSSGNIKQSISGRAGKLERGKTLLSTILAQGGKAPEKVLNHFGTTKSIPAVEVSFDGTPDYRTLTDSLKQQGTSLDELARHGYHARASEKDGKITLTFKQRSSNAGGVARWFSGHDKKLSKGAEVLRQIFGDASMIKASGKTIQNQALSKEAAKNYLDQLTTESTNLNPADNIEWPTNPTVRALVKSPNDLSSLSGLDGKQARQALDQLARVSFLLDENSAAAKLLARQGAYLELFQEMHEDQDLNDATDDYLKHAINSSGHFDDKGLRFAASSMLQHKLAFGVQKASGFGSIEPVSPEAVNCWKERNTVLQQALELGLYPNDVQQLLVRSEGLSYSAVADLITQEPKQDYERQLTPLFKARDELDEQIKERKVFNQKLYRTRTQLDDVGNEKLLLNRLLSESETRLNALKNPSDELIEQLKNTQHNPMAEAAKLEKKISSIKKQLESLNKSESDLQFEVYRLEDRAADFSTTLSEMQDKLAIYQQLETEHVKAGQLLNQITEQAKTRI
ncbi:MAG: hypothetical protein V2J55_19445 [Candidatus Competibacteraceae bacterium]|nr:hypothetical protein [Candidatus Competibacteraceae bacterium]